MFVGCFETVSHSEIYLPLPPQALGTQACATTAQLGGQLLELRRKLLSQAVVGERPCLLSLARLLHYPKSSPGTPHLGRRSAEQSPSGCLPSLEHLAPPGNRPSEAGLESRGSKGISSPKTPPSPAQGMDDSKTQRLGSKEQFCSTPGWAKPWMNLSLSVSIKKDGNSPSILSKVYCEGEETGDS